MTEQGQTRRLDGRVALVTGGASGIGRAVALTLAREGAAVAVGDVAVEGGEETAALAKSVGAEAFFARCDVSQAADVEALTISVVERFGSLDCAFNNAGIEGTAARSADCTEENWDRVLAINLKGVWLTMKYEIRQMLTQRAGSIVNTASVAGLVGWYGAPAYTAAKHGVLGLTKAAALEYATPGIRVNAVCPGVIETPMLQRLTSDDPDQEQRLRRSAPVGRVGDAQEVASAVVWLLSDEASYVTGHALTVDGGYVAR